MVHRCTLWRVTMCHVGGWLGKKSTRRYAWGRARLTLYTMKITSQQDSRTNGSIFGNILISFTSFAVLTLRRTILFRPRHRGSTGPAEHFVRTTELPIWPPLSACVRNLSPFWAGTLSVATCYDSAWIGGTASGWIFIQICDCAWSRIIQYNTIQYKIGLME